MHFILAECDFWFYTEKYVESHNRAKVIDNFGGKFHAERKNIKEKAYISIYAAVKELHS